MTAPSASPALPHQGWGDAVDRRWTTPLDLAIAGAIGGWAILEVLLVPSANPLTQLGFAVAIAAPLAVRRRLPATVMLVIAGALVIHAALSGPHATFNPFPSLLVATFTVAERIRQWWLAAVLGAAPVASMLAAHALGYFGSPGIESAGTGFLVFFVGATWSAGRVVRQRALALQRTREGSRQVADRAAASERRQVADRAAASERRRIARELHDIVAHSLSIVALQAAAAEQFVERDPVRARTHLNLTRRTAQEALAEMRHLLDVLREDGPSYVPQPGLSGLPDLVAETRAAGHDCTLDLDAAIELPDGLGLAVHRIVQESLTNVRKYAPGAPIRIQVVRADGELRVEVTNAAPGQPATPGVAGSGSGIPGMTERARIYGGTLEAGPRPDGGWSVSARLPMGATS